MIPPATPASERAQYLLSRGDPASACSTSASKLAEQAIDNGARSLGVRFLRETIEQYSGTDAADQARQLLGELGEEAVEEQPPVQSP